MTTLTSDCLALRRAVAAGLLLCGTACGLIDDDRSESNKYIYLTFYDKGFEALCLEHYDLNGDGRLSRYEAQRVVTLDCAGAGLTSLTDLREFSSLRRLDCRDNALTELDLSYLSALEEVRCDGNSLTRLDVDNLRGLTLLTCRANALQQLDLASVPSLARLDCRSNRLRTLDVSSCAPTLEADLRDNADLATVYCTTSQTITSDGPTEVVVR